ncbi:patatin-like phospholipase family protein [Salinarimonas soli]|nr:patatin-like phospholipase family protein [Salinarimonas soli]
MPNALAGPKAEKTVCLALQGGGAHGAFTWGVLDAILEDGRLAIEAITGASAGAMNAVVLAEGFMEGGTEGARGQLEAFWRRMALGGSLSPAQRSLFGAFLNAWSPDRLTGLPWGGLLSQLSSPYDFNPLNINPLRDAVADLVDFDKVRACQAVKLFVAATNVFTGKIRIFENAELTPDHVMASACLPTVFQAVTIDGEPYWDGGYMGNPAIYPVIYGADALDVVLVQINPVERRMVPRNAQEIQGRLNEITFNGGLLRELRAIDFVSRLVEEGRLSPADYKRLRLHRIDGEGVLDDVTAASRLTPAWSFLEDLRDRGRATAKAWLASHYDAIGKSGTLDLKAAYS